MRPDFWRNLECGYSSFSVFWGKGKFVRSSGSHYRWIEKGRRIIWNIVIVYKFNAEFQLLV